MNDIELTQTALQGNQLSYSRLFYKYYKPVFFFVNKFVLGEDVLDMVQVTFIKAFVNLSKYDVKYTFITWLYRIAENSCKDLLRSKEHRISGNSFDCDTLEVECCDLLPDEQLIKQESEKLFKKLLTPYLVLQMFYLDDLSYLEIQEKMNLPMGSVKQKIFRAKARLKEKLEQ